MNGEKKQKKYTEEATIKEEARKRPVSPRRRNRQEGKWTTRSDTYERNTKQCENITKRAFWLYLNHLFCAFFYGLFMSFSPYSHLRFILRRIICFYLSRKRYSRFRLFPLIAYYFYYRQCTLYNVYRPLFSIYILI